MARLSGLLHVVLAFVVLFSVSANVVTYTVTFVACVQGLTCPQGNPSIYSQAFALNGSISPNVSLNVGDTLVFNLATTVSSHPLTICQNSPPPSFCQGATGSNELNQPITQAGTTTSFTFTTAGTYYYGCNNHPGMGATINVIQTATATSSSATGSSNGASSSSSSTGSATGTNSSSSSTARTGAGHQLSAPLLLISIIALLAFIFT